MFNIYTLENKHGTQKWSFGIWISFSTGGFLGSVWDLRGVMLVWFQISSPLGGRWSNFSSHHHLHQLHVPEVIPRRGFKFVRKLMMIGWLIEWLDVFKTNWVSKNGGFCVDLVVDYSWLVDEWFGLHRFTAGYFIYLESLRVVCFFFLIRDILDDDPKSVGQVQLGGIIRWKTRFTRWKW